MATKRPRTGDGDAEGAEPRGEGASGPRVAPVVFLNVGGATRNIRRSLLLALRDASGATADGTEGEDGGGNPLVDFLLQGPEHWSDVPTIKDASDGRERIYLDRNPDAFDDLLQYIEYGRDFLREIVCNNGREGGSSDGGLRLMRLRMEGDYFTVDALAEDIDCELYGEPASFRADGWFTLAGQCTLDDDGGLTGWGWNGISGNEEIASKTKERSLALCEVKATGMYLIFFSLHSVAVTALPPGYGYTGKRNDEFCTLSVFHDVMTETEGDHWTYPILRCGAFDCREDEESRKTQPLLFTAACVEPISLRKSSLLYCEHGTGVVSRGDIPTTKLVAQHSNCRWIPECVQRINLIRLLGGGVTKLFVTGEKGEPTVTKWTLGSKSPDRSSFSCASINSADLTKVQIEKAGYYILLGRVAARLVKRFNRELTERPAVQLELRSRDGAPLHIVPEIISWPIGEQSELYNNKWTEYGPIQDVIWAERGSAISMKAISGACFAQHGTVPVSFGKIPAQSLSVIRLHPSARVDRYQISTIDRVCFERALGRGEDSEQDTPLFHINQGDSGRLEDMTLCADEDFQCMVIGSLSSSVGSDATLLVDCAATFHSQLCKGSGRGAHSFGGILCLKQNDCIGLKLEGRSDLFFDGTQNGGQLAFVVLR